MSQVTFTDPRTANTYAWPANPNIENTASKARIIERTSNTGNVGSMKQQGDDGPLILDWQIIVQSVTMETALWQWYTLSKLQTIYVADWDLEQWEGQIIMLSRQRVASGSIPAGGVTSEYATYQMQFEVYRCISGVLATAGVTP